MDNQHNMIKGYRDLNQDEIDLMNEIKALGEKVSALIWKVKNENADVGYAKMQEQLQVDLANEFIKSAEMDLRVGFMKLVRSVAKPNSF